MAGREHYRKYRGNNYGFEHFFISLAMESPQWTNLPLCPPLNAAGEIN
jgi:hypothetical protein